MTKPSFLPAPIKAPPCAGRLRIFGYGSLVAAVGINGRAMRRRYTEDDVIETHLNGYRRSFNAALDQYDLETEDSWTVRFFGIDREIGSRVNGVVFEIAPDDWAAFRMSEGGDSLYWFRDVTADMTLPAGYLKPGDRVLTCATKQPSKRGVVSQGYLKRCRDALAFRSPGFKAEFGAVESYLP